MRRLWVAALGMGLAGFGRGCGAGGDCEFGAHDVLSG